jgi:hypothetical protein
MPCRCKHAVLNVPDNADWGPAFWKVLHGLAECAGKHSNQNQQRDEMLLWKNLLTLLKLVLPCPECREHLATYCLRTPIDLPDKYQEFGPYVRDWLYVLHEDVNRRLGKPSFPRDQIQPDPDRRQSFAVLQIIAKRAIYVTAVPILTWGRFANIVQTLLGMY